MLHEIGQEASESIRGVTVIECLKHPRFAGMTLVAVRLPSGEEKVATSHGECVKAGKTVTLYKHNDGYKL